MAVAKRRREGAADDLERAAAAHPQRVAFSRRGMAATAHYRATEAGVEILEAGGNAMGAAVAAAFALGVCEPAASGLGGQTMMLVHDAKSRRNVALDGSSRAPNRATPGLLEAADRQWGWCASTVPATPAVLEYARRAFGTMPLEQLIEPALRLALEGCRVTRLQRRLTSRAAKHLRRGPAGALFLRDDGKPHPAGAVLRQPVLAKTLHRLAKEGVEDFYTGEIARTIHEDMERYGGLIQQDDLAQIPWPIERRPVTCRFEDLRVLTSPPPGAGRTLAEMLNVLSQFPPGAADLDTPEGALLLAEVCRRAFIDRRDRPYDPNLYPQVDEKRMLSADYSKLVARQVRARIRPGGETTHLSVMDNQGNAVALTQSIERVYGACVASPTLGFLYNNYMCDFEYQDMSHPHYLRPNAVPWASVAPTLVFRGRRPWLAIGSPGSERIAPSIAQVLLRLRSMGPMEAVSAPRLYCDLEGTVHLEASRMRNDIPRALERRGFRIRVREPFSFYMGCVQLVMRERRGLVGVADLRRDGSAGGPEA